MDQNLAFGVLHTLSISWRRYLDFNFSTSICLTNSTTRLQAFLSVFSKPVRRKHSPKTQPASDIQNKRPRVTERSTVESSGSTEARSLAEAPAADSRGNSAEDDSESDGEVEDMIESFDTDKIDEDKLRHNNAAITASVNHAFEEIEKKFGIKIAQSDRSHAQQLIP